jgi:hypothetical protein
MSVECVRADFAAMATEERRESSTRRLKWRRDSLGWILRPDLPFLEGGGGAEEEEEGLEEDGPEVEARLVSVA